jgi:hypothetical protein
VIRHQKVLENILATLFGHTSQKMSCENLRRITMASKSKKLRVTLDLTQKAASRLKKIQELLESDTKAGVIRQSLQLHEYLLDEVVGGKKIFIGSNKESSGEVVLFHRDMVKK